jgi:hypothetical protein
MSAWRGAWSDRALLVASIHAVAGLVMVVLGVTGASPFAVILGVVTAVSAAAVRRMYDL